MDNPQVAIVPAREQVVDFYGDAIPAAQTVAGEVYVPINPLSTFLGLSFGSQRNRILRDSVLTAAARMVVLTRTDGVAREFLCLPLKLLPGWLFGITASRVKPELRAKIERYQADCYEVLWNAFKGDILPAAPPPLDLSLAEQALLQAEALANLARQQLELERRYNTMAGYMRGHVQQTNARLSALELQLGASATISELQAAEVAGAVKLVAAALEAAGTPNGYGRVYNELYHRYGISSYKMLPLGQFAAAMAWLRGWYDEVGGDPNK